MWKNGVATQSRSQWKSGHYRQNIMQKDGIAITKSLDYWCVITIDRVSCKKMELLYSESHSGCVMNINSVVQKDGVAVQWRSWWIAITVNGIAITVKVIRLLMCRHYRQSVVQKDGIAITVKVIRLLVCHYYRQSVMQKDGVAIEWKP